MDSHLDFLRLSHYGVHDSAWGDWAPLHIKGCTDYLSAVVCLCIYLPWSWTSLLDAGNDLFLLFALLVFFLSGQDAENSRLVIFFFLLLCHVRAFFLCFSKLLNLGGHRDLKALNKLLWVWPRFIELSQSLQKVSKFLLGIWNWFWLCFGKRTEQVTEVVGTLMNNTRWLNIDWKNITAEIKLFGIIFL